MKMRMYGFIMSLAIMATSATADQIVNVDGEDYFLSHLTENCQSITDDPAAQISCYTAISQLLDEQTTSAPDNSEAVATTFEALRVAVAYQNDDTGMAITGTDCTIQILYYGNYFHVSRRNISEIDLFAATFDASDLQIEQTLQVQGSQAPLLRGTMAAGSVAATRGGLALDSAQFGFAPRSPRTSLDAYAIEVADQLVAQETQVFDFPLIHPQRNQDGANIWAAFEAFVSACKG